MTNDKVARLTLLGVTTLALAAVCYLAGIHTISDGETVAALSAALSAFVGGHAAAKPPSNGGNS